MQHLFWRLYVMFCTHTRSGGNLGAFLGSFLFQLSTATAFLILGLFCFGVGTFGVAINVAQRRISKQVQPQVTLIKPPLLPLIVIAVDSWKTWRLCLVGQ
jgi:ABC-type Fe3+-siderophore transport system permease subunit